MTAIAQGSDNAFTSTVHWLSCYSYAVWHAHWAADIHNYAQITGPKISIGVNLDEFC